MSSPYTTASAASSTSSIDTIDTIAQTKAEHTQAAESKSWIWWLRQMFLNSGKAEVLYLTVAEAEAREACLVREREEARSFSMQGFRG